MRIFDDCRNRFETALRSGGEVTTRRLFDEASSSFQASWSQVIAQLTRGTITAHAAAATIIDKQEAVNSLAYCTGRYDTSGVAPDLRDLISRMLRTSDGRPGPATHLAVPHVGAGFAYMTTCTIALRSRSWTTLHDLLHNPIGWRDGGGRMLHAPGFTISALFHSEAMNRNAPSVHDLFREKTESAGIISASGLTKEEYITLYNQTQFIMSLQAARFAEQNRPVRIWADFGRFYAARIYDLVDAMHADEDYGSAIAEQLFHENRRTFFARINSRLNIIRQNYFGESSFMWRSLEQFEPREHEWPR